MPKLTEDSLKKRFTCQYCGKSIRSRQGLSGHIQFKHQKKVSKPPDLTLTPEIALNLKMIKQVFGFSTITLDDAVDTFNYWIEFELLCNTLNIELNQQDLKHYVIASLVQIHQNHRLKEEIINSLSSMTHE